MRKEINLPITEEDLKFIVEDEFEDIVGYAKYNSFCRNCFDTDKVVEMINYDIILNDLNDVVFKGVCKSCGGKMGRYIEIGEHEKFRLKTEIIKAGKTNNN